MNIEENRQPNANRDDITWAMAAHLSAFLGHFLPPIGQIIGPALIWLFRRDSSAFVGGEAREALNAQISYTIYWVILGAIAAGLSLTIILIPLAILLLALAYVGYVVVIILATVEASRGKPYRYPFIMRFVK